MYVPGRLKLLGPLAEPDLDGLARLVPSRAAPDEGVDINIALPETRNTTADGRHLTLT